MTSASVRYIVDDVDAAIAFYRDRLGFDVEIHPGPGFAMLRLPGLRLLLSASRGTGGGSRPDREGHLPHPGGWNRIQIETGDIEAAAAELRSHGAVFRTDVIDGFGGRQVVVDDPSGNPIELFEPALLG